jgi:type VII secretion-associated protein (TIGR03931 family)
VSATVLLIGPGTVSGPHPVPAEICGAAIDAIDDEYTLIDERPVAVDDLWAWVLGVSAGEPEGSLLLVCPGWWSDARVNRIRYAAGQHDGQPEIVRRHDILGSRAAHIIEIAPEFVICRLPGSPITVTPRLGEMKEVAGTITRGILGTGMVVIDAPVGVAGAAELAAALAKKLDGRDVQIVDDATLAASIAAAHLPTPVARRRPTTAWAVSAGLLLALGVLLGLPRVAEPAEQPFTLLTEGRVTVRLPAGWEVRRITDGAGSPRIQASSPIEEAAAILLTQSVAGPDLPRTAEVLEAALALQPPGVFTGLRTDDHRGGRAVLSYTETRADREISWAVFLDGRVRIAVGCQQPASAAVIRQYCDEAIRSAREAR